MNHRHFFFLTALLICAPIMGRGQDRIRNSPAYQRYVSKRGANQGLVKGGSVSGRWIDGGKAFEYSLDGKSFRFDSATKMVSEVKQAATIALPAIRQPSSELAGPTPFQERGRQATTAASPNGMFKAIYKNRNLFLESDGKEIAITSDGSEANRVKSGSACWVYGEELAQRSAMWWSPNSKKLAFYRFDESKVQDYFLSLSQTKVNSTLDIEPYPKAGAPNPVVDLLVYDVETKQTTKLDIRDGKPFEDATVGYYAYAVEWSPDGKELIFHRTNRRQNVMELTAANPDTGKCRVIVREEWPASWTDNRPSRRYLKDNNRFLWMSERNGFRNYYLYDLSGKLINPVTQSQAEVANIVRLDEDKNELWYMARDGKNHMLLQLHRVGLDGKGDQRLTDPQYLHTVDLAPDGSHFIDTAQNSKTPPFVQMVDRDGKALAKLTQSDATGLQTEKVEPVETFEFKAADGQTILHGNLHKPSNFDPGKKYPVLVSVYGGPATNGANERFSTPNALTELGVLYVTLDARSAAGRGKKFLDAIYEKLGVTEIDDFAAGIRSLFDRPYVDRTRVGIYGTSYGGYTSAMALLRYPDVFSAACANSPVTDWRNYDTIYTERYMYTPQDNGVGYAAGSAMTYADKLKGRLMLYYGTADNNVHPANSLQLISALQRAGKSFEVQVGPDRGHTAVNTDRMLEFFFDAFGLWEK